MLKSREEHGGLAVGICLSELAALTGFGISFYLHEPVWETIVAPLASGAVTFCVSCMSIGNKGTR